MPNTLTIQQLTDAKAMINRGDVVGFYDYMYSQGYGYANLAKGVVECSLGSGGATALQYMTDVALQAGINLTTQQVAKIEIDMANGYANTLLSMANESATKTVSHEINGDQALTFHNDVFDKNGLPREAWTLYTPSQYLSKEQFNDNFAASIATGANAADSASWITDMYAKSYTTRLFGEGTPQKNIAAADAMEAWINKVYDSSIKAVIEGSGLSGKIAACSAGVQQAMTEITSGKNKDGSIDTPTNPSTRNSDDYISDTSANDHQVIIKTGGRVWDAYVSQKNSDHGFKNWDDFKAAVAISNPDIADLNKIDAGTTLMMPEKFADGSVTYNFAGGTSINSNAVTGEYHMVVQNADGGQTVYSRTADGDAGYSVHQVSTDKEGNITSEYNGYQATLDSEVKPISLDWKTPTETGQADWGDDGSYQTTPLRTMMLLQSCNESNYQRAA